MVPGVKKMTTLQGITPPSSLLLEGNVAAHWKQFKQKFENYLLAINAGESAEPRKVALFLTVAGDQALDLYNTLPEDVDVNRGCNVPQQLLIDSWDVTTLGTCEQSEPESAGPRVPGPHSIPLGLALREHIPSRRPSRSGTTFHPARERSQWLARATSLSSSCQQRAGGRLVCTAAAAAARPAMAPMGIRLSPLGVAVFALLAVGVLYHFYSGFLAGRIAIFRKLPGSDRIDLRELLALSVEAAVRGGEEVKRVMEGGELNGKSKGKTKEGADEILTTGDLLSHQKMYHLIKNTFPTIQVFSEERDIGTTPEIASWDHAIPKEILDKGTTSEEVSSDSITIWIDPLDATYEYTEKLLHYVTTMVCVAVNGKPVIGVIHKPFADFTAWAMVHGGSNVSMRKSYNEKDPKIIISRSHPGPGKAFAQKAFGNDSDIREAGGAGYKVLSLLNIPDDKQPDHADVYLHVTNIKKWDICAGNALLEALGGQMTTLKGKAIDYTDTELNEDGIVASIGVAHKKLLAKLPDLKSIKTE